MKKELRHSDAPTAPLQSWVLCEEEALDEVSFDRMSLTPFIAGAVFNPAVTMHPLVDCVVCPS